MKCERGVNNNGKSGRRGNKNEERRERERGKKGVTKGGKYSRDGEKERNWISDGREGERKGGREGERERAD